MTKTKLEIAMKGIFFGAERVRAHKHSANFSENIHRQLTSRILSKKLYEDKNNFNLKFINIINITK